MFTPGFLNAWKLMSGSRVDVENMLEERSLVIRDRSILFKKGHSVTGDGLKGSATRCIDRIPLFHE